MCLSGLQSYAQQSLKPVKFDELITISFPGETTKLDTIAENTTIYQQYVNTGNETYILQRLPLDQAATIHPDNKSSLMNVYEEFGKGYIEGLHVHQYKLLDQSEIEIDGFVGYKVRMKSGKKKVGHAHMLIYGDYLYIAAYFNQTDFNTPNAEAFLNSFTVRDKSKEQYEGDTEEESAAYNAGRIFGRVAIFIILAGIFTVVVIRRKKYL